MSRPRKRCKNLTFCAVRGCLNRKYESALSFFHLPKERQRRNKWLPLMGRNDLLNIPDLRHRSYAVCSAHFDDSTVSVLTMRKLLPGAMPSKYLPGQTQKNQQMILNPLSPKSRSIATQTYDFDFICQAREESVNKKCIDNIVRSDMEPDANVEQNSGLNILGSELNPGAHIGEGCGLKVNEKDTNLDCSIAQDCDLNIVKKEITELDCSIEQNVNLDIVKTEVDPMANYHNNTFSDVFQVEEKTQNVTKNENILLKNLLESSRKMTFSKSQIAEKRRRLLEYELDQVKKKIEGPTQDLPSTSSEHDEE